MFRTKKDVERHVVDTLSKIDNENEKNLRGFAFARLFYQVKDYGAALKYLSGYLSVRDYHAPAHKLLAQIYEATNNPENALQSYRRSLEIDSRQNDIVLKICELYCQLPVDHETAKYWADRAEQIFPHNEIVFKLRESLVLAEGDPNHQQLEVLIASELRAQPKNVDLRIKLLRLYLDTERVKEAYEHATLMESKQLFATSPNWYYMLIDIYEGYQEEFKDDLDSQFYINYLTALDHLMSLKYSELHSRESMNKSSSLNDVVDILFSFDKYLLRASEMKIKEGSWMYFLNHMKGQIFLHMTCVLLKRAKLEQGNKKEALRFSAGLSLVCYSFKPVNLLQETWFSQMTDNQKIFTNCFQHASNRTCFIGYVIKQMCKEDKNKWLQKIKSDVCIAQIKERIFNRIFSLVLVKKDLQTSFFIKNKSFESCSLEFPTDNALKQYDKSSYMLCSSSLHHLVWLEYNRQNNLRDNYFTEMFKGLQYNNKNLSKGSCESLCVLDLEAYLCATVYQIQAEIEKKKATYNGWNQDLHFSCPPDVADPMCSKQQAEWWRVAHGLNACVIKEKLGESRQVLQQGLEVIRGIGNHGMEVQLVVHLAKTFSKKAELLLKDVENQNDDKNNILPQNIAALQLRATHYWNVALGMLEKLISKETIRLPKEQMFASYNKELSISEMRKIHEDGKLYLAVQLMESDKLEDASEILSKLSSPYASFYLALTLKKIASEEKNLSSAKVFMKEAQKSLHETMDRIKDDASHPLNKEIHIVLEDIENELGVNGLTTNGNDDADEIDSYDASPTLNSSAYESAHHSFQNSTPKPSSKFTSFTSVHGSTLRKSKHFEPSPERLDAQIRALTLNQDIIFKTIMEQNKSILDTNNSINACLQKNHDVLSDLKKQLEELSLSERRARPRSTSKKSNFMKSQGDDEYENFDPNVLLDYYDESNEEYRASGYNYNSSSHMASEAAASLNYVVPPGPPSLAHYNYQYPPHAILPTAAVPERPPFYHTPGQSLPFSEGQQLPQFHFHVSSPVVKPPVSMLSNVSSIPHPITLPPPPPPPPMSLQQPSPIVQTSNNTLSMTNPWSKPGGVPHAFQIPLPSSTQFVSTPSFMTPSSLSTPVSSSTDSQSALKNLLQSASVTTFSNTLQITSSAPSNTQSSMFNSNSKTPEQIKAQRSRYDSESGQSPDVEGHDIEKEVMGDFKPLIPLPDEVVVETGEENEKVLFEDRAKLYRFVDQEWKERGIGIVKLLYHEESKRVRLLMRRDQVLKVCANHYITSDMEVKPLKSSDRAWTWVAQDFADEKLKPEQFCIRFKTSEIAFAFKTAFDKAVSIVEDSESNMIVNTKKSISVSSPGSHKTFGSKLLHKSGSWSCPNCYINNSPDKISCEACETRKPGSITSSETFTSQKSIHTISPSHHFPTNNDQFTLSTSLSSDKSPSPSFNKPENISKSVFGGFTFSTSPTISQIPEPDSKEREILVVSTKSKGGPQVTKVSTSKSSPFSGFSFTSPPSNTNSSIIKPLNSKMDTSLISLTSEKDVSKDSPAKSFDYQSSNSFDNLTNKLDSKYNEFTGFSFKTTAAPDSALKNTLTSTVSTTSTEFSLFQSLQNVKPTFVFSSKDSSNSVSSFEKTFTNSSFSPITATSNRQTSDGAPEDFVPTAEFKPVVPLPALVDLKTGEEEEEKIFCERAKLFRYDSETKEWKERGTGELKILYLKDSGKYRVLMRRDQVLKICANHCILPEMKLTPLSTSTKAWVWCAQDFSEGDLVQEKFAARFKNVEISKLFYQTFEECKAKIKEAEISNPKQDLCNDNKDTFEKLFKNLNQSAEESVKEQISQSEVTTSIATLKEPNNKQKLSDLFKPQFGSWECEVCMVRNTADKNKCASCETNKPGLIVEASMTSNNKPSLSELFKPQPGSWTCETCMVRNAADIHKCASCETKKPGLTTEASKTSNNKPSLSELFKPQPGSWTCETCMLRNSAETNKCLSCETNKPGTSTAPVGFSKFKLNTVPSSGIPASLFSSESTTKNEGFVFGTKPSLQPSTFTFGQSTLTKSSEFPGFKASVSTANSSGIFGDSGQNPVTSEKCNVSIPPVTAPPTFVFGSSTTTTLESFSSVNKGESVEFRFGSPQKYEFNFSGIRPLSPSKTPKSPRSPATPSDVEEEDEVESSDADNIYFSPVIPLPPKVEVKTGEENENVLFCNRAKLYRFSDGEWKERGLGDVKILTDEKLRKARLLMRREQVLKVCLNHHLSKEIKFESRGDKSIMWAATDFSENEPTPELFTIRFKTAELAQEFKKAVDDALNIEESKFSESSDKLKNFSFKLDSPNKIESNFVPGSLSSRFELSTPVKSDENSTVSKNMSSPFSFKTTSGFFGQTSFATGNTMPVFGVKNGTNFSFGFNKESVKEDSEDIKIVYEALPPPDKIAAAEKLKLPKTFYLYENKVQCPGCIGCTDMIPAYKEFITESEEVATTKESSLNSEEKPFFGNYAEKPFLGNSEEKPFFGNVSFTDLAGKSSLPLFSQSSSSSKSAFAGAGTPLFSNLNTSAEGAGGDDTVPENPDIHFEPIIPLPDLVEVKTGEEDEDPKFVHRAKLFRFDSSTKQWKERGIGDIKILSHKQKTRFRIILRRDQVHKLACNHCITEDMSLSPLSTSENAVCWNALDYSESQPEASKFAVRFKAKEILDQFKDIFNECVEILKKCPKLSSNEISPEKSRNVSDTNITSESNVLNNVQETVKNDEQNSDSASEEEDILFEKRISLEVFNEDSQQFIGVGIGSLRIVYDDDVYGYRVTMINDKNETLCDHIIAIQNCLRTEGKAATWSAIDMSIQPSNRRRFRASFSSVEALNEFSKCFEEGKENAVQSGIVENEILGQ